MLPRRSVVAIMLAALAVSATAGGTAQAATPSGFSVAPTADLGGQPAIFVAIAAPSHTDAWIAGEIGNGSAPLLEHWNGASWSIVTLPGLPAHYWQAGLGGVSATSATDVWVSGSYETFSSAKGLVSHQLLYHLTADGWHRLGRVANHRDPIYGFGQIVARSATDVWAFADSECAQLIEHYNGTRWKMVTDNDECDGDSNYGYDSVTPIASGTALALGTQTPPDAYPRIGIADCLPSTSNGCPAPLSGAQLGTEEHAAAGTEKNLWVIGETSPEAPLAYDWNGTAWTDTSPSFGYTTQHELRSATLLPDGDLWAVGDRTSTGGERTLILSHSAAGWHDLGGPNVGSGDNALRQVVHVSGTASEMWAIGTSSDDGYTPLLLHHP